MLTITWTVGRRIAGIAAIGVVTTVAVGAAWPSGAAGLVRTSADQAQRLAGGQLAAARPRHPLERAQGRRAQGGRRRRPHHARRPTSSTTPARSPT